MTALCRYIAEQQLDRAAVMDALQGAGVVSDVAVWPEQVAECDAAAAVALLRAQKELATQRRVA